MKKFNLPQSNQLNEIHFKLIRHLKNTEKGSTPQLLKTLGQTYKTLLETSNTLRDLGLALSVTKSTYVCNNSWLSIGHITEHLPSNTPMPPCYLFNTTPSSNDTMISLAKTQKQRIALCLTEHQSAGRGQFNNTWISPMGCNLYFTLLHPDNSPHQNETLSEQLAHWTSEAIQHYGIHENFTIKPPNDILFQGKKLAGILTESLVQGTQSSLIIGIGVNLNMSLINTDNVNQAINQPWTDLASIACEPIDRNRFCACLLSTLLKHLAYKRN